MGWTFQQKPPSGWPLDLDAPINKGLIAHLSFLEGSGASFNDFTGILKPSDLSPTDIIWKPGEFGLAPEFNGSSSYIGLPIAYETEYLADYGTIVVQVRIDSAGTYAILCRGYSTSNVTRRCLLKASNTDVYIYYYDTAQRYFRHANVGLTVGKTHQVAWSHSTTADAVYIDGVAQTLDGAYADFWYGDQIATSGRLSIGRDPKQTPSEFLDGLIEALSIYNRVLSPSEIALLYTYPFCMFQDPAEMILETAGQVSGTILPQITSAYMRMSS